MPDTGMGAGVGAAFTASIVIDKNDLITQALKQLSTAQKELEKNKLEIYFDLSNKDLGKKLKEYQKQLASADYTIKIKNDGIEETYKSLDKLLEVVKLIASQKPFGTGFGDINTENATKQISKLETEISKLTKKYEMLEKKSSSVGKEKVSGKNVNLVDNKEFKKLSESFEKVKGEVDDLKTHLGSLNNSQVNGDQFTKLGEQVSGLSTQLNDLIGKYRELSNAQKALSSAPQAKSAIPSGNSNQRKDAFQSKNSNQKSQEIKRNLEAVAQSENKARQEAIKTDKAINNINFIPNTEGFDEIVSKFKLLREEAEQIVKITKTTRQAVDGTFSTSYTAKLKNGSTYNLDGNRQSQMSSANEVIYNSAEREKQIWEELSSELNRYATLQKKIARGTALESEKNEANELLKTIRELQRSDILSPEKLNASNKKLSQIRQSFKDIRANVEKNTTKSFQSKIETAISNAQKKYDEYSIAQNREDFNPSTKFETTLSTLGSQINNLKEKAEAFSKTEITTKKQRNEVEELIQKLEETKTSLNNMSAAEKGVDNQSIEKVIDRINKVLKDNTRFSKAAKKELKSLITLAESGSASAKVITTRMLKIKNAEVAAGRAGKSFFDIFKSKTFYGFIGQVQSYLSMYVGFYGMVNAARNTISTITELDTALVDLKKTTSMNTTELNQFYFDSNKVAKQMGVTTQAIIEQASSWSRLGYSTKEQATEMAKLSSQFSSISPGMDTDTSQQGLVSIMKAWSINPDDVKSQIMDPINQLGKFIAQTYSNVWHTICMWHFGKSVKYLWGS